MRRPLVAGNWKMNGTRASVAELIQGLLVMEVSGEVDVAVLPGTLHVLQVGEQLSGLGVSLGAQDCAVQSALGALTGEVSSLQLRDAGCEWVLVGHSERRLVLGEDDVVVARKFAAALEGGLKPVLCVGETLEQREAGKALEVIEAQLASVLEVCGIEGFVDAVVAYEPVWAIGTGRTATPDQAQEVHAAIRSRLAVEDGQVAAGLRILYGGSVKSANAAELFAMPDIDGGLIGGASLDVNEFSAICRAARK